MYLLKYSCHTSNISTEIKELSVNVAFNNMELNHEIQIKQPIWSLEPGYAHPWSCSHGYSWILLSSSLGSTVAILKNKNDNMAQKSKVDCGESVQLDQVCSSCTSSCGATGTKRRRRNEMNGKESSNRSAEAF